MSEFKKIPKRYHPKGYDILYEDRDIFVGNKAPGYLSVRALWNKDETIHAALNRFVRKGNPKSRKCVFVVHRLDQATSGILIFAKSPEAQTFLKDNWASTKKIYYAVVHGHLKKKEGVISSYLSEDEDYMIHSSQNHEEGRLAKTAYKVIQESAKYSLLEINLLTGRKNQIRVHLAELGHPVVGDDKYGRQDGQKRLALHAYSISFIHPFSKKQMTFCAPLPKFFNQIFSKPGLLKRGSCN